MHSVENINCDFQPTGVGRRGAEAMTFIRSVFVKAYSIHPMHTNAVKFDNIPAEETCRFRASLHPIIHKLKERMDSCSKTENKEDQGGILQKTNNSGKGKERAANKGGLGEAAKKREEVQD